MCFMLYLNLDLDVPTAHWDRNTGGFPAVLLRPVAKATPQRRHQI